MTIFLCLIGNVVLAVKLAPSAGHNLTVKTVFTVVAQKVAPRGRSHRLKTTGLERLLYDVMGDQFYCTHLVLK